MSHESLEQLALRGNLNFEHIVVLQIQRCLTSVENPYAYSIHVGHLLRMLPPAKKNTEEFKKRLATFTVTQVVPKYTYSCGKPIGTPDNPVFRNNKSDWNYDPLLNKGEPIRVSPVMVKENITDWEGVLELCMDVCDEMGISWKKLSKGGAK